MIQELTMVQLESVCGGSSYGINVREEESPTGREPLVQ